MCRRRSALRCTSSRSRRSAEPGVAASRSSASGPSTSDSGVRNSSLIPAKKAVLTRSTSLRCSARRCCVANASAAGGGRGDVGADQLEERAVVVVQRQVGADARDEHAGRPVRADPDRQDDGLVERRLVVPLAAERPRAQRTAAGEPPVGQRAGQAGDDGAEPGRRAPPGEDAGPGASLADRRRGQRLARFDAPARPRAVHRRGRRAGRAGRPGRRRGSATGRRRRRCTAAARRGAAAVGRAARARPAAARRRRARWSRCTRRRPPGAALVGADRAEGEGEPRLLGRPRRASSIGMSSWKSALPAQHVRRARAAAPATARARSSRTAAPERRGCRRRGSGRRRRCRSAQLGPPREVHRELRAQQQLDGVRSVGGQCRRPDRRDGPPHLAHRARHLAVADERRLHALILPDPRSGQNVRRRRGGATGVGRARGVSKVAFQTRVTGRWPSGVAGRAGAGSARQAALVDIPGWPAQLPPLVRAEPLPGGLVCTVLGGALADGRAGGRQALPLPGRGRGRRARGAGRRRCAGAAGAGRAGDLLVLERVDGPPDWAGLGPYHRPAAPGDRPALRLAPRQLRWPDHPAQRVARRLADLLRRTGSGCPWPTPPSPTARRRLERACAGPLPALLPARGRPRR